MSDLSRVQDVIKSHDETVIEKKLVELLEDVGTGTGSPITIYCAQLCSIELQRIAVGRLHESSKNLECLTKVLIVLTIVLGVFAVPPAIEAIRHLFS